jgi:integrase/recombinase XerD
MNRKPEYFFDTEINQEVENFKTVLKLESQFAENTIIAYSRYSGVFLVWLNEENIEPKEVRYNDIIAFIHHLQLENRSQPYISRILASVRYYYKYYLKSKNNPAAGIYMKGIPQGFPKSIVDCREFNELYNTYPVTNNRSTRNRIMLGLLIYQALTSDEIRALQVKHIQLREAKIKVPQGKHSNARVLDLQAVQLLDLKEYLEKIRPRMLRDLEKYNYGRRPDQINRETIEKQLFFSCNGSEFVKSSLWHLFREIKQINPKITSATVIRQSVIAQWLKEKGIRQVQYMSGHRYISSTQRYRDYNMDELSNALQQFHPLQ